MAIIKQFLAREDSVSRRSRLISRTGVVAIIISEGFAWTLSALAVFVLIIFLATHFLPISPGDVHDIVIATSIVLVLVLFCGIPLLLGLVLILKDLTYVRSTKSLSPEASEAQHKRETAGK